MKKLAIIVDGITGMSKVEVEKNSDFYYLPLSVIVDGVEYVDGVDKPIEEMMAIIDKGLDVKTSQPTPARTIELFEKLSSEYENVIYLCIGSALSGTFSSSTTFAQDFPKVKVLNNTITGGQMINLGKHLINFIESHTIDQTIDEANKFTHECINYVVPLDIKALIRGGRMGKAVQIILQTLKAVPIIGYDDTIKLNKKMVKRSGDSAVEWALTDVIERAKSRWGEDYILFVESTPNKEILNIAETKLKALNHPYHTESTSGIIAAHAGNGAISITAAKKTK